MERVKHATYFADSAACYTGWINFDNKPHVPLRFTSRAAKAVCSAD